MNVGMWDKMCYTKRFKSVRKCYFRFYSIDRNVFAHKMNVQDLLSLFLLDLDSDN